MKTVQLNVGMVDMQVPYGVEKHINQIQDNIEQKRFPCGRITIKCVENCYECVLDSHVTAIAWIKQVKESKK